MFITAIGIGVVTNGCFSAAAKVIAALLRLRLGAFVGALLRRRDRVNAGSGEGHGDCTVHDPEVCCMSLYCRMDIMNMIWVFIVGQTCEIIR
jgi:hypothetical protein